MAIKTDMLRYFVEVAQVGNLAKAADNLGRSPAAVSMMLKQFEEHVGAPLFETDRKNRLTSMGRFALTEAENELDHFDQTVSAILKYAESGEASIRVLSIPTAASTILPTVVANLYADNPKLMINVSEMLTGPTLHAITLGTADIGVVNEFMASGFPSIDSKQILSDPYGILCPRDSVIGRKNIVYWSDLEGTSFIDSGILRYIEEPAIKKALQGARMQVRSVSSLHSFVRSGMGVTVVSSLGCRNIPNDLIFRIPEGDPIKRKVFVVWNNTSELSVRGQMLVELLSKAGAIA